VVELTDFELEACIEVAREAAKREGLFLGYSAGAILCVALREARRLGNGRKVVVILPDDGYKYLSTNLYPDEGDRAPEPTL
jgi:cysteine synthase A